MPSSSVKSGMAKSVCVIDAGDWAYLWEGNCHVVFTGREGSRVVSQAFARSGAAAFPPLRFFSLPSFLSSPRPQVGWALKLSKAVVSAAGQGGDRWEERSEGGHTAPPLPPPPTPLWPPLSPPSSLSRRARALCVVLAAAA